MFLVQFRYFACSALDDHEIFSCSYLLLFLIETFFVFISRGLPHSTYAKRGRGGVKPNAYDCIQGGSGVSRLPMYAKKNFWTTKSQLFFFFMQKKLLHSHLLLCIEKCKPALSYK